jgi:hypothetical protein
MNRSRYVRDAVGILLYSTQDKPEASITTKTDATAVFGVDFVRPQI